MEKTVENLNEVVKGFITLIIAFAFGSMIYTGLTSRNVSITIIGILGSAFLLSIAKKYAPI